MKPTTIWNIKFNECKRFILRRSKKHDNVLVRGEIYYKSDIGTPQNVCRPRKTIKMINPIILPSTVAVKKDKLNDVSKLLSKLLSKHFGPEWQDITDLSFYKEILLSQEALQEMSHEDIYCDEVFEEPAVLRV